MSKACRSQLSRRERLVSKDYRTSRSLTKACKAEIRHNKCRPDKEYK